MNHLVAWLWQGVVIAGATTLAVRLIPPASASKRYVIWWMALGLTLLLPLVEAFDWFEGPLLQAAPGVPIESSGITLPMPPAWLSTGAVGLWAGIAILSFCRLAFSWRRLRQLVLSSVPFAFDRAERLPRWRAEPRSGRRVELRVSHDIAGACAVGFGRPTILVSSSLAATLNDDVLESIVLHEQAHLQRYDDWARAVQCVVLGVARWHPAVLWISRQIDLEREMACDQRVIVRACTPLAYARSLAQAAELIEGARGSTPVLAPGASTTTPMLRLRIERLLAPAPAHAGSFASWISAAVGIVVAAIAIGLSNVPQLITFTAGVQRSVTLSSNSFLTGVPHELPAVLASEVLIKIPMERDGAPPQRPGSVSEPTALSAIGASGVDAIASNQTVTQDAAPVGFLMVPAERLGSTSIPFLARIPRVEPPAAPEPAGVDWGAVGRKPAAAGTSLARAGTAAGASAARAGTSVGRFFKNGGLAIARSF